MEDVLVENIEDMANLWGLKIISHMGFSDLILEGDSLVDVEAIKS